MVSTVVRDSNSNLENIALAERSTCHFERLLLPVSEPIRNTATLASIGEVKLD
jgi:hypothetical protein